MSRHRPLDRRDVLQAAAGLAALGVAPVGTAAGLSLAGWRGGSTPAPAPAAPATGASSVTEKKPETSTGRMPVLYISHGSPMNALEDNAWSRGWRALAAELPRPRAILSISAHWFVPGIHVTGNARPHTIHDFGGFPRALFEMQYPAPGDEALAQRVVSLLGEKRASVRMDWGLDHGTWTVLHHLRPGADCPVVQLSIDERLPASEHLALGRALAPLREEGVLVLGSGSLTHNLRHAFMSYRRGDTSTPAWADAFDADATRALEQRDGAFLSRVLESDVGRMSHPTPEHYLPLLYAVGASDTRDAVRFPVTGFDMGSLSMRSARFG